MDSAEKEADLDRIVRFTEREELLMKPILSSALALGALISGASVVCAQPADDLAAVMMANNAFYAAQSALDAPAMDKVWAHKGYVANAGPRAKAPTIGWTELQPYFVKNFGNMAEFSLKPVDTQVQVNGNAAWVIGKEEIGSTSRLKDGTLISSRPTIVTNIFEKDDGKWLMVAHHAQEIPK
jgi:ketosteroid isomerase-like protein